MMICTIPIAIYVQRHQRVSWIRFHDDTNERGIEWDHYINTASNRLHCMGRNIFTVGDIQAKIVQQITNKYLRYMTLFGLT